MSASHRHLATGECNVGHAFIFTCIFQCSQFNLQSLATVHFECCLQSFEKRKFHHVTPGLRCLHHPRIHTYILLLVWKALHGLAPQYMSNKHVRSLRSSGMGLLALSRFNRKVGEDAFSFLCSQLLSDCIRSASVLRFESRLRTFSCFLCIWLALFCCNCLFKLHLITIAVGVIGVGASVYAFNVLYYYF